MGLKWRPEIHVHDIVYKIVKKNDNRSKQTLKFVHLFSFLTLIVINISPGKKTTYIFILTNILYLITEVSSSRPQCSEIWSTVIKGQFTLLTWPEVFTFFSTRTKKFSDLGLTWSWPCSAKLNLYTDITKSLRNVREERNRPSSICQW